MTNRKRSTICLFIFLFTWVSSYATYGGLLVNVFGSVYKHTNIRLSFLSFVTTGLALFLFVYVLYPEVPRKETRGLGCRVIGCVVLATFYKAFRIKKRGKRGYFSNTEGKFDKTSITRTKELLMLYALILPTIGLLFFAMIRTNAFYDMLISSIKPDVVTEFMGLYEFSRLMLIIAMLVSYFCLWPLLKMTGVKNSNSVKFLIGHLLAVLTMFYAAIFMKTLETLQYSRSSGFVRIFNTRAHTVSFDPMDSFTTHNFTVNGRSGFMSAYPCYRPTLFSMSVSFNRTSTKFTMFLSVEPDVTTGYMVLDPPEVIRIRGPFLPLREGPPGTNIETWPKVFIYNTAKTLQGASIKIKKAHQRKILSEVVIEAGIMKTITLFPDSYDFVIMQADIKKTVTLEHGGLYGLLIYATTSTREMNVDRVVDPSSASSIPYMGMFFLEGLSTGIGYVTLRAIVYAIAPHGLMAMSFAYLAFLEGISLWIMYIGFITWHYFVTASVMFAYSFGVTFCFFVCMFVLLKYRDSYNS